MQIEGGKVKFKNQNDRNRYEYGCTVVSLLPYSITENKPLLLPSEFVIPGADSKLGFAILHVREAIHWIPNPMVDEGKPGSSIKQTTSPAVLAESIVKDFCGSQLCLGDDARPGMFYLEGIYSPDEVQEMAKEQLAEARRLQNNWYRNLARMADADWQQNKNIRAVSDIQRFAAKAIGHKAEWVNYIPENMPVLMKCQYCMVDVNPEVVKCPNCKEVINKEKYNAMVGAK